MVSLFLIYPSFLKSVLLLPKFLSFHVSCNISILSPLYMIITYHAIKSNRLFIIFYDFISTTITLLLHIVKLCVTKAKHTGIVQKRIGQSLISCNVFLLSLWTISIIPTITIFVAFIPLNSAILTDKHRHILHWSLSVHLRSINNPTFANAS